MSPTTRARSLLAPIALTTATLVIVPVAQAAVTKLQATYSAGTQTQNYAAGNVGDGNQDTYWKSANNAFPQWIQADLGAALRTDRVVLKLPTASWGTRTQTLSIQGSTDGNNFTDLVAPKGYEFNPAAGNTFEVRLRPVGQRDAGTEPGSAGGLGDVQRPAVQQQLPGHQEHHVHLHDHHQLIPCRVRTIQ